MNLYPHIFLDQYQFDIKFGKTLCYYTRNKDKIFSKIESLDLDSSDERFQGYYNVEYYGEYGSFIPYVKETKFTHGYPIEFEGYNIIKGFNSKRNPLLSEEDLYFSKGCYSLDKLLKKHNEFYITNIFDKGSDTFKSYYKFFDKDVLENDTKIYNEKLFNSLYKEIIWNFIEGIVKKITLISFLSNDEKIFMKQIEKIEDDNSYYLSDCIEQKARKILNEVFKDNIFKYPNIISIHKSEGGYFEKGTIFYQHLNHYDLKIDNKLYYWYDNDKSDKKEFCKINIHDKEINFIFDKKHMLLIPILKKYYNKHTELFLKFIDRLNDGFEFMINDHVYRGKMS